MRKYKKFILKPNYNHTTIFSVCLMAVYMNKIKILLNKPSYVGMCILDLSKELMYDFHYNVMKPKYGNNIDLCYQDTNSDIYDSSYGIIRAKGFYKDMKK